MNKKMKIGVVACFAFALTAVGAGLAVAKPLSAGAENAVTAESVSFTMDEGAGVRIGTNTVDRGIRFAVKMERDEYDALTAQVGEDKAYQAISFGMVITPASSVSDSNELTKENLFGAQPKFDWDDGSANWEQAENTSLVVHYEFDRLGVASDYEDSYVAFASLTNIKDGNLTREFIARAYMKYTDKEGAVAYRMADYYGDSRANNTRSIAFVAQKAIESDKVASEDKTVLTQAYITHEAVASQTTSVTVNHHKIDVRGKESVSQETLTGCKIGATAQATAISDAEWVYDEEKSTADGVVYANGKTTLDLYYNQNPEEAYDLWFVGEKNAIEKTVALEETVTGGRRYDKVAVELKLDLVEGTMPRIKFYALRALDNAQLTDPAENNWITVADGYDETKGTYTFSTTFAWANNTWNVGAIWLLAEDGEYKLGVDVVSVKILPAEYDAELNRVEKTTYRLDEAVTGAVRYDKAIVTVEIKEIVGDITKVKLNLYNDNLADAMIANNDNAWYTLADCKTASNTYALAITFPWNGGDWTVTSLSLTVDGTSYVAGINVKSVAIEKTAYQLEYSVEVNSQTKVLTFDKVAGGKQGDYVKVSFDVAVFYKSLTNIQFNLCTDTAGKTLVANSNKLWAEDGTKLTSSGGQYALNCSGKKTVTLVTTFPWANGNWDLQSIALQFYGTGCRAGVSNLKVELLSSFTPLA